MTDLDLHRAKSRQASAARVNAMQAWADKGPHLDGGEIVIPSYYRHPQRARLQEHGFRYQGGVHPGWRRKVRRSYLNGVYSGKAWLVWALKADRPK